MCPLCIASTASLALGAMFSGASPLLAFIRASAMPAAKESAAPQIHLPFTQLDRKESDPHA